MGARGNETRFRTEASGYVRTLLFAYTRYTRREQGVLFWVIVSGMLVLGIRLILLKMR